MKLLTKNTDYNETINLALHLNGEYNNSVIFHCYWNGILNEKHFYSILSCYYFNIYNDNKNKHKIILWLENNLPNEYNEKIKEYAEIKVFSLDTEKNNTIFLKDKNFYYDKSLSFYSDVIRYILLYNYGGVWFDLDCFFLRNFDPLFYNFENDICVYQWETQNYPNGAIFISLKPNNENIKKNMEFIIDRNRGWGFQEAELTFDLPLNFLVLPCSWFDGSWIENPYNSNLGCDNFFKNQIYEYNFDNFFKGSFCYHWHNRLNMDIEENSITNQLVKNIQKNIK
jgi:hypothetical protein